MPLFAARRILIWDRFGIFLSVFGSFVYFGRFQCHFVLGDQESTDCEQTCDTKDTGYIIPRIAVAQDNLPDDDHFRSMQNFTNPSSVFLCIQLPPEYFSLLYKLPEKGSDIKNILPFPLRRPLLLIVAPVRTSATRRCAGNSVAPRHRMLPPGQHSFCRSGQPELQYKRRRFGFP